MNMRILSALAGVAGAALSSIPAQAAITVLGGGPAQFCYRAADEALPPRDFIAYCDQALMTSLSPADRAATYINRGVLRLVMKNLDGANQDFNAALAINDKLGEAYVNRGATLIAKGQYAEGLLDLNRGLALGTSEAHLAYYDRAIASEALGNLRGAYDDYRMALTLQPNFEPASNQLKRFKIVDSPNGT